MNIPTFKSKTARILITSVFLISVILFSFLYISYVNATNYSNFPGFKSSDRILVFAPHPDDESLGTAGVIKKALEKNATVLVVVVTDGSDTTNPQEFSDYKRYEHTNVDLVETRHQETLKAMKGLGLNGNNVIFLGYPDTGLKAMFEDYWDPSHPYRSNTFFNHYDRSPYNYTYQKNAPYTGANVAHNMEEIITDYKPDIIFYPDGWDAHTDHWATNAFVMYSAAKTNYKGKKYTYLVHEGNSWPSMSFFRLNNNLTPPQALSNQNTIWIVAPLNATEENAKRAAIDTYQLPLFFSYGYLNSFIRSNELFAIHPPLKLEKINKTDFFQSGMPNSSYKNVIVDPKTRSLEQPADLSTIGLAYNNQNLYLILKTTKNINKNLVYNFHFRIFNGQEFKRIDIIVTNGKAEYQEKDTNSIQPDKKPIIQAQGNLMVLTLPINNFKSASFIMMNTEVYDSPNKQYIDLTPWKELNFKNKE